MGTKLAECPRCNGEGKLKFVRIKNLTSLACECGVIGKKSNTAEGAIRNWNDGKMENYWVRRPVSVQDK